ncbi:amino acid adenylation domain-containing protein [Streptomyces syringium]|uniref:amino acid adenylation domain-containing protein n=1 Tax=Streptomyces syringium TaxID=76729 RepID=UPI0033AACAE3
MTLWTRIAEFAAARPDQPAYVGADSKHTYTDLLSDVTDLSRQIEKLAPRDHVVAVSGQRGYGTLTCLLACLATGRVYLPVDERWPAHRVDLVVSEAGAAALLKVGDDEKLSVATTYGRGTAAPRPGLGYIIFTSGSTGLPRGVMVEEAMLEERLVSLTPLFPADRPVRFVLNTSIAFDISLIELLIPLLAGGTVVCPPPLKADPQGFADFAARHGATHIQGTPSFFKLIEAFDVALPAHLEAWCGGEALDPRLAGRLVDRFGSVRNFYGPTEATIWCTFHTLTPHALDSVGLPFGGTEVLAPGADAWQPTELVLAGRGLAVGYVRPADDEGRFVELPGRGRAYRTGDLGWVATDGRVHVAGRIDHQVKVNGYRLELTEIESAVESHPTVRQCAAFVLPGSDEGSVRLAAAYVADMGIPVRELREHLRRTLPSYAVPQHLRRVDELPLTTAGKVDRQILREMAASEAPPSAVRAGR